MSVTTERSTLSRYSSTSVSRAMPTKTSRSLSLRMRTSPRIARAARSEPLKSTSALSETIAYVAVEKSSLGDIRKPSSSRWT